MKHVKPRLFVFIIALAPLFAGGCGEDPLPQPVDSFCTVGDKVCEGNYVASCIDGGKAYKLTFCGDSRFCSMASGTAQCKDTACEKGALSCNGTKVMECPADGSSSEAQLKVCDAGDKCLSGTCVPAACDDGDARCGWRRTLICSNGAWTVTKCTGTKICKGAKCVDRACQPHKAKCNSSSEAAVCTVTGDAWAANKCKAGEKCYDGVCHREVKDGKPGELVTDGGKPAADAGGSSSGVDVPGFLEIKGSDDAGLDKPDKLSFIFSDTATPPAGSIPMEFSISSVQFLDVNKMLQITGDEGLFKIEVQIAKLEEFQTGTYSPASDEGTDSAILMNDGTTDQSQIQWKYQSTDYSLTVTDFEAVDGRVKGTFNAEMGDRTKKGATKYIVDGKFDIKRSQ